jgi:1,2-diacylglycerol 3-beta-glucosyltransferase
MYNATTNLLTRMQDIEFVTFTEVFQRGRESVGSVGLGGNGQFTRLLALQSLGHAPWTACLTEDLDLGISLTLNGWKNRCCSRAHVSQQAVTTPGRLLRQRTRWFQGHLQCWRRIPEVIRSHALTRRASADLTYHLVSPGLLLLMCAPMLVGWLAMTVTLIADKSAFSVHAAVVAGIRAYLIAFLPAWLYGVIYSRRTQDTGLLRGIGYGHAFVFYSYLWMIAGWRATGRTLARRSSWSKTTRTLDVATAGPAAVGISPKEGT